MDLRNFFAEAAQCLQGCGRVYHQAAHAPVVESSHSRRYAYAVSGSRLRIDPRWDPLRSNPRFLELISATR